MPQLLHLAAQRRALREQKKLATTPTKEKPRLPLGEWIPTVSSGYSNPKHLQPLLDLFQRIDAGEAVRAVIHAPPRHAKTETVMHGVPWLLERHPRLRSGYFTYSDDLSLEKSRIARRVAETAGIQLEKSAQDQWSNRQGGGLIAGSVGGTFTGRGVDLLVMDDLFKNRMEADSSLIRDRRWEWWQGVAATRLEKNGSALAIGTRWHPDDVQGRLVNEGWEYICLPAMDEFENALWPERFDAVALKSIRETVGEYNWIALYIGAPRHRGGKVFGDPTSYRELPNALRIAIGLDFAYSEKTHADWSVAVVLGWDGAKTYVIDVIRVQVTSPKFKTELRKLCYRYPASRLRFLGSGTEKGTVDNIRMPDPNPHDPVHPLPGINVEFIQTREDKFQRAQGVAAAWNIGNVLVPEQAPWLNKYIDELRDFTGVEDAKDDQVDGTINGFDIFNDPMPKHEGNQGQSQTKRRI